MNKKLQVFVSSTYTDLIEERQAAVQAILDAGHIPAGMELFKAGKSQMKTIQKWIDESDVYMLILGGRYGSIEEESGLSYTELEYKYALSKNMPVFAIVLEDSFLFIKAATKGKDAIFEKDNLDKYDAFKEFIKTNLVKFVKNIDQITINIHSQLNDILNDPDYNLIGWIKNEGDNIYDNIFQDNINKLNDKQIDDIYRKILFSKLLKDKGKASKAKNATNSLIDKQLTILNSQTYTMDFYIKDYTRNIGINLHDEYIEIISYVQFVFKGNDIKDEFSFFPWVYPGIEEHTYEFVDVRYNAQSNQNYIKRGEFKQAANESYVTGGIGINIPYDKNVNEHNITYKSKYHVDYAKFFHSFIFKNYCERFYLSATLHDYRKNAQDDYLLKWEMFTPNQEYGFNSRRKISQTDTEIRFSPVEWMTPGCGYIITINQVKPSIN